jgi:DNA-binding transcriptional regulator/RsmH inhibitor MraZ
MTANFQRYKGYFTHKVDGKFRVSIPPGWRPEPGAPLFLHFARTHEMPMIKVLTQEAYEMRVQQIQESSYSIAKKQMLIGRLAMLSREVTLNEQGKLLVPKELSEEVDIAPDSEVRLAGRGPHFEIWNKAHHQRFIEIEMNAADDEELGIF